MELGTEEFWTDDNIVHFLTMAYMDGWSDRDMAETRSLGCYATAKEKAKRAVSDKNVKAYE